MSLYIPGLNLPPKGKIKMLVLFDDGIVIDDADGQNQWQAIEVPPHGRLVDADAMLEFVDAGHLRHPHMLSWSDRDVESMIESRQTIIPADGEDKEEPCS